MRSTVVILCSLPLPVAAFAQSPATSAQIQNAAQNERTRELGSLHGTTSASPQPAASAPWKSLSNEEGDDPTISAAPAPPHEVPKTARKAAEKAEHLAKKGRHDEAIAGFKSALAIDPLYYEAANNLALEQEAAGDNASAEQTLRDLIAAAPAHTLAFGNLGILLCKEGRYADAEAVARQALKAHKYSFKASFLLGTALVDQGKWTPEAKSALEYAHVKYPEAGAVLDKWPPPQR